MNQSDKRKEIRRTLTRMELDAREILELAKFPDIHENKEMYKRGFKTLFDLASKKLEEEKMDMNLCAGLAIGTACYVDSLHALTIDGKYENYSYRTHIAKMAALASVIFIRPSNDAMNNFGESEGWSPYE